MSPRHLSNNLDPTASLLVRDREDVLHVLPAALVAVTGHAQIDTDGGRHADRPLCRSLFFPGNSRGEREIPGNGASTLYQVRSRGRHKIQRLLSFFLFSLISLTKVALFILPKQPEFLSELLSVTHSIISTCKMLL